MFKLIIWVGLGGMLGSIARYLTGLAMAKTLNSPFPWSTFTVNILGCLFIGLFYSLADRQAWLTPELRLFLTTGFCGGFTTFSTFAVENINLLQSGNYLMFALYSALSFGLGLAGVIAGILLGKV
jgi:CrcB protein